MTTFTRAENVSWADDNGFSDLILWADPDREIADYYDQAGVLPSPPSALLFDSDGVLVLIYQRVDTMDDFTADVAGDADLLWGSR